jgi:hypothetical protein
MNICFVANFFKTYLFDELAKRLATNDISVFWIVVKSEQNEFLKAHYKGENILYINRSHGKLRSDAIDDFKLNELLFGDRVLKHEMDNGLNFLTNIQAPIYHYLLKNKIRFIFGEITWAHELLIQRICKKRFELNCDYLQLGVVRIPNGRFAFFRDETENTMMLFNELHFVKEMIKIEKPNYLELNDQIVSKNKSLLGRLDRLKRFVTGENIEKNDPNVIINILTRMKFAIEEEFNKSSYALIRTTGLEEIEAEKFVFYGFHKQPESSIDVLGRYYEDQFVMVTNLWRRLPFGWKLVVKEHTNAIGDRPYSFYKKLLKYPNIILANERINSKFLIEKSQLVATVSGTIAYEAALMKKPAITFAKVFFNGINYCKAVSLDDLLKYDSLADLILELNSQPDNRFEFSNYLMSNTFEGYITDPRTDPTVLGDLNLQNICNAFMKLISCYA